MKTMIRFGKKIILESTMAIKHQVRTRMRVSDQLERERQARENEIPTSASAPASPDSTAHR